MRILDPDDIDPIGIEETRAIENERLARLYLDEREFNKVANRSEVQAGVRNSLLGDKLPKVGLNASYLGYRLGRKVDASEYEVLRDSYAKRYLDRPNGASDEEFYNLIKGQYQHEVDVRQAESDLRLSVVSQSVTDQLTGRRTPVAMPVEAWQQKYPNMLAGKDSGEVMGRMVKQYNQTKEEIAPYIQWVAPGYEMLKRFSEGNATNEELEQFAATVADIPRDKQDKVLEYIRMAGEAGQIDKNDFLQFFQNLGQTLSRGFNYFPQSSLQQKEVAANAMVQSEDPVWVLPDGNLSNAVLGPYNPDDGYEEPLKSGWREATEDERRTLVTQAQQVLNVSNMMRRLKNVTETSIDPIKRLAAPNTWTGTLEGGVYGVAGSIGPLAATAVNPVLGALAYQSMEYDRIMLENRDIDPSAAQGLALVEGVWQAAIDRLQLKTLQGSLPVLGRFLGGIKSNGVRRTLTFAGSGIEQFGQEIVQDGGTMVIDAAIAALREDMPDQDLPDKMEDWVKNQSGETAVASFLFGLVGGGVATAKDVRISRDMAKIAGLTDTDVKRIELATTDEERQTVIASAMDNRTPESIAAGEQYAKELLAKAQAAQDDPLTPTLKVEEMEDGGKIYTVTDPDGGGTLIQTSNVEDAQSAIADWLTAQNETTERALRETISYWESRDPELSFQQGESLLVKDELDRMEGIGDAQGIAKLHARLVASNFDPQGDLTGIYIFGATTVEDLGEDVYKATILLRKGAKPETVLEEVNHAFVRRALMKGTVTLDFLSKGLAETEAATGITYKRDNETEIIESVAQVALDALYGRVKLAQVPQGIIDYISRLLRVVKEVYQRAIKVTKAFDSGQVSEDFSNFIMESMGLPVQKKVEINSERVARELTEDETWELERSWQEDMAAEAEDTMRSEYYELLESILEAGGLPSATSPKVYQYAGEYQRIRDASKGGNGVGVKGVFNLFRKNAPDIDALMKDLRERGFSDIILPDDLFNAIERRIATGEKVYGLRHSEDYSIGRTAITAADESAAMEDAVKDFERELSKPQQERLRRVAAKQFSDVERDNTEILRAHDEEGKPLPAPNGKPSKLNRRQWVQVRTPLFKRWFGDWEALARGDKSVNPDSVSKVVDENGEPMVVYHGTPDARFLKDDPIFRSEYEQFGVGRKSGAHWFSTGKTTANSYADDRRAFDYQNAETSVFEAFLDIKNPEIVNAFGRVWRDVQKRGQTSDVIKQAQSSERDGVIISGVRDDYVNSKHTAPTTTLTVWTSNQIKSATGNEGMFSGSNRIDYSIDRVVPPTSYPESAHKVIATTNVSALTKALLKADESLVILDPDKDKPMMVSPVYKRAKREGGMEDARDIVLHFLTPKRIQEYADALEGKTPVFLPVQQREGEATNTLPILFAKVLAQDIGGRVSNDVHQIKKGGNTGASAIERGNRPHDFVGSLKVNEGESVVLVDDTFTSGNTLAALYDYLHAQGINAEHVFTIAASRYGKDMAAPQARQQAVLDKLGMDAASFQRATGLPIEAYTGSELQGFILLRGNPGIQSFLDRFHEGRNAQDSRLGGHARLEGSEQTYDEKVNRSTAYSIGRTPVRDAMHAAMSMAPGERLAMYQRAQKLFDQANERRKAMQDEAPDKYAKTLQSLWELDAILKVLPPEVRGRVGGYTSMARLGKDSENGPTQAAVDKFLAKRLEMVGRELDRYLAAELRIQIERVVMAARPKMGEGKVRRSTLGPEAQAYADKVYRAMFLNNDQTVVRQAAIEAALASSDTPDAMKPDLSEEWAILNTFGDIGSRSAEVLNAGLTDIRKRFAEGRSAWRMTEEARIAEQRKRINDVIFALGEATKAGRSKDKKLLKVLTEGMYDYTLWHQNFEDFLKELVPVDDLVKRWAKMQRIADRQSQITEIANREALQAILKGAAKAGGMSFNKAARWFSEKHKTAIPVLELPDVKDERVSIELAIKIVRGDVDYRAHNLSKADVASLRSELVALPRDTRKEYVEIKKVIFAGNAGFATVTPGEAIQLVLSWEQSDVQEKMRREGWTDESAKALRSIVDSPMARPVYDFLKSFYAGQHAVVNPVYARMMGMNLAQVSNYAPTRFDHAGDTPDTSITALGMPAGNGSTPSFAKSRVSHSAPIAVQSAFTVFHQYNAQMSHWVAYAELAREIKGVMQNMKVRQSMKQSFGEGAVHAMGKWVELLEKRGDNKANEAGWLAGTMRSLIGGRAIAALGFNLKTILIQADSATRFGLALSPKQIAKAMMNPADLAATMPKVWHSDTIQRRLKGGMNPAVQFVMSQAALGKPGLSADIAHASMQPLNYFDAAATTLSAAIVFRANYLEAQESGMSEAEATRIAADAMDEAVYRFSQPTGLGNKSLMELSSNSFFKMWMLFLSDPRLKTGVIISSVRDIARGKNVGMAIQRIVVIEAMALVSQVISNAYRDWLTDDDDDDIWSVGGFALALAAAPVQGFIAVGAVTEATLSAILGQRYFTPSRDPLFDVGETAIKAASNLDKLWTPEDGFMPDGDIDGFIRELDAITRTIAITPSMGASAAMLNIIRPFVGGWQNAQKEDDGGEE